MVHYNVCRIVTTRAGMYGLQGRKLQPLPCSSCWCGLLQPPNSAVVCTASCRSSVIMLVLHPVHKKFLHAANVLPYHQMLSASEPVLSDDLCCCARWCAMDNRKTRCVHSAPSTDASSLLTLLLNDALPVVPMYGLDCDGSMVCLRSVNRCRIPGGRFCRCDRSSLLSFADITCFVATRLHLPFPVPLNPHIRYNISFFPSLLRIKHPAGF